MREERKAFRGIVLIVLAVVLFPTVTLALMESTNYKIPQDVIGSFGNQSTSESYILGDTGGEFGVGPGSSANYKLNAGFWQSEDTYIAINCPVSLVMASINGVGQSSLTNNYVTCVVRTNYTTGYTLYWRAGSVNMTSGSDSIGPYTPATPNVAETWSVASNTSEWGGHLGTASTTFDAAAWGAADTYAGGKWLNIGSSSYAMISRVSATSYDGDNEIIYFGAEIGAAKVQPNGTYSVTVTMTGTTN